MKKLVALGMKLFDMQIYLKSLHSKRVKLMYFLLFPLAGEGLERQIAPLQAF